MAQYIRLESPSLEIANGGLMRQLVLNGTYQLPKGYSIDFYGFFDARSLRVHGYRNGWKFYNMTLNKKFRSERLNLSLRGEAFLTPYVNIDEVIRSPAYAQRQSYHYQNQNLRFSASYELGKKALKSPPLNSLEP